MKRIALFLLTGLFAANIYAQTAKPEFLNKKNQHSISAVYWGASYSYAHKFNPKLILGARLQVGFEVQAILASSKTLFDYGYGDGPEYIRPSGYSFEILKLQYFYRHALSKHFYFDAGPVASMVVDGGGEWTNPYNVGIEATAYYSIWKIHMGFTLKGAMSFSLSRNAHNQNSYFAIYPIPLNIGFDF